MEIEEIEGEFCVMKDGEKMKCFATKEEADAYQVSLMAQSAAEVKALKQKLEATEKLNKDLTDKVSSLDQLTVGLTEKFSAMEERTKIAEIAASQLKEQGRKAENEAWLSKMTDAVNLKILPWEKPFVAFILDASTGGSVKTYADNGAELSVAETFKKLYEERKPGMILTEELSTGGATSAGAGAKIGEYSNYHEARREAVKLAKAYMQEHPEVKEFSVAFNKVLGASSELKEAVGGVSREGARKSQDGTSAMSRLFKR